jgi:hypothetical protein
MMLRLERSKSLPPTASLFKNENTFRDSVGYQLWTHGHIMVRWPWQGLARMQPLAPTALSGARVSAKGVRLLE